MQVKESIHNLTKYFDAGDPVRVIDGKHRGETGLVTGSKEKWTFVALD